MKKILSYKYELIILAIISAMVIARMSYGDTLKWSGVNGKFIWVDSNGQP